MSQRKSILATEEGSSATPGSPLRRSTRIANSPAPPAPVSAATAAPLARRRNSAAAVETTTSTPAKVVARKRPSLSHEVLLEEKPQTPKRAPRGSRAASKSPSAEPEVKPVGTPSKRGRRSSVSKIVEEGTNVAPVESPVSATPKPRGRRASINQIAPMEAIAESETKTEAKKVGRPRAVRRTSMDIADEAEKKEEKKPTTRRSIRGRSNSVDIPEEPEEPKQVVQELNPINEEESEPVHEEAIVQEDTEEKEKKAKEEEATKQVTETDDDEIELHELSVREKTPGPLKSPKLPVEVFKSPVRRSPRLSASPASQSPTRNSNENEVTTKISQRLSEVFDVDYADDDEVIELSDSESSKSRKSTSSTTISALATEEDPVQSEVSKASSDEANKKEIEQRRSMRQSVSPMKTNAELGNISRRSLRKSVSPSPTKEGTKSPTTFVEPNCSNVPASPKRRSLRLSESQEQDTPSTLQMKRKSSSSSESDPKEEHKQRLSRSFGENTFLNTVNTTQSQENKTESTAQKTPKKDTLLREEADMTFGSDGSFHLNISIPPSTDSEANDKSKTAALLNCSGSSNNSDKENGGDKLNIQTPAGNNKRLSLNDTSTPKVNVSITKMESFCEPMEVDLVNESIVEVDNADEFGSSPIKKIKDAKMNNTTVQSEEELQDELMQSFVDEVSEVVEATQEEAVLQVSEGDVPDPVVKPTEVVEGEDKKEEEEVAIVKETDNHNRSKKRKLHSVESLSEINESDFKSLIAKKLETIETSDEDEDDDDYQPANEFVDDQAMEGEEDTPSEGSNDIPDDGESLHSSESDAASDGDDDEYENDSFIADDESIGLLSGHEYDLDSDEKPDGRPKTTKKRKSRIITVSDSSDEEVVEVAPQVASAAETPEKSSKVVILQDIKIGANNTVINEEDNLKSLETIKQTTNIKVPSEPKPSLSTPNNSIIDSPNPRKTRRKTSLTIQEQIKVSNLNDGAINEKISKAVDYFVSSIKEKTGNVSVNVSLDYANNSMSSEEGPALSESASPKRVVSLKKEDIESINSAVDEILETTANELNCSKLKKMKKNRSSTGKNINVSLLQDEFEVFEEERPTKKTKRVSSNRDDEPIVRELSPKKKLKLNKSVNDESKKEKRLSINKSLDSSSAQATHKCNKRRSLDNVPPTSFHEEQSQEKKTKKKSLDTVPDDDLFDFNDFVPMEIETKPKQQKAAIKTGSKLEYFPVDMLVEDEINAQVTRTEIPGTSAKAQSCKKSKKLKPSSIGAAGENGWDVQITEGDDNMPSRRNKDRVLTVKAQVERLRQKFPPNDFKNQMIYNAEKKRMDCTQILKKKQSTAYTNKKGKK